MLIYRALGGCVIECCIGFHSSAIHVWLVSEFGDRGMFHVQIIVMALWVYVMLSLYFIMVSYPPCLCGLIFFWRSDGIGASANLA